MTLTLISCEKGGSGKSTITCNLAPLAAARGSVLLIDKDPQATSAKWGEYRRENPALPPVATEFDIDTDHQAVERIKSATEIYDHVMVDMPGHYSEETIALLVGVIRHVTCPVQIIAPLKTSQPDIDTLLKVSNVLGRLQAFRPDLKIVYLMNECPTTNGVELRDTLGILQELGIVPLAQVVYARRAYRDSMAEGKSAAELTNIKARDEITDVFRAIFS